MRGPAPRPTAALAEQDAFDALYRATGRAVLGYALRRAASREDALDAVAETFTVAWRRRGDTPAEPDEVRPWLFGIARRCLADIDRSATRAGRLGAKLAAALDDRTLPDPGTRTHDHGQVRAAMARLSESDRELVALIAWEGLTPAQAAAALDLTPGTARVRLHRARARLKHALSIPDHHEEADHDR